MSPLREGILAPRGGEDVNEESLAEYYGSLEPDVS